MSINQGFENERLLLAALHQQHVSLLPANLTLLIKQLFEPIQDGLIQAYALNMEQKADICIQIHGVKKYLSIKSGDQLSFHSEPIETFIPFLKGLGISTQTLKTMLFFHYGDRTLNGTGPIRYTSQELRKVHAPFFKKASVELSQPAIIAALLDRVIFKGRFNDNQVIDGIYYGNEIVGKFIARSEIKKILLAKKYRRKNGTINIGNLSYQPKMRNLFRYPNADVFRHVVVIKWRSFRQDIGNIHLIQAKK
jgi:hypothetical protein